MLYKLIDNHQVSDDEFNQYMVMIFDFGGINDREIVQQNRSELVKILRKQPRMSDVISRWKPTFSHEDSFSETQATAFICEVLDAVEDSTMWITSDIYGGTANFVKDSINDIHLHLSKARPSWSMILTVEGCGRYNCIRRDLLTYPGDIVLFSPSAIYDIRRDDSCQRWVHHHVHFPVWSRLLPWLQWPEVGPNIYHLSVSSEKEKKRIAYLFKEIISTDPKEQRVADDLKKNLLEEILIRCHELALRHDGIPVDNRIKKVATYINDHFDQAFTIESLTEISGMSRSRLATLFKKQMGVSLLQSRHELRIAKACRLLQDTSMHISTIAEAVGYEDPLYFGRCFRRRLGCSPSEYRKR